MLIAEEYLKNNHEIENGLGWSNSSKLMSKFLHHAKWSRYINISTDAIYYKLSA